MHPEGPAGGPEFNIGPHRYQLADGIFLWQPNGEVLPDHARTLVGVLLEVFQQRGCVLYLLDGRDLKPMGPEARRVLVEALQSVRGGFAMAAFNTSLRGRTTAVLVFSAARLLTGLSFPFKFTTTEAEARAFLTGYRDEQVRLRRDP